MGLFKKIASIAAPVAGAIAGGPMLAPLGMLAGSKMAGSSLGDPLGTKGYNPTFDTETTAQQRNLAEIMRKRATGEMPSYAETVTKNALLENLAAQQAGVRSIGGISGALKQRMMANAAARSGSEIARRGGEASLNERNAAIGQYGDMLGGMRSQYAEEEGMRQGAFENKQAGKRTLWTALGQGIGSAAAGGKGK